ncbi:MAG: bifunctional precorrin-2 dehydrogenase/sirohydrochlorin ferrochelatase [Ruminococcus sp.]|nr:bifunctional precorrin-2 dehydrogenase/sirohydrochlorin ferrochelatase [Ruminococcus sp.]
MVVGGGGVALRKIEKLLPFEPHITVIAPEICSEIQCLDGIEIICRRFRDDDLERAFMAVLAACDNELNARIYELCRKKNILVNTVDDMEKCGFLFPALVKRGDITVGISTSGRSPVYAGCLRKKIDEMLDGRQAEIVEILGRYRPVIKDMFSSAESRKSAFVELLELCLSGNEAPDDRQINNLLEELLKNNEA